MWWVWWWEGSYSLAPWGADRQGSSPDCYWSQGNCSPLLLERSLSISTLSIPAPIVGVRRVDCSQDMVVVEDCWVCCEVTRCGVTGGQDWVVVIVSLESPHVTHVSDNKYPIPEQLQKPLGTPHSVWLALLDMRLHPLRHCWEGGIGSLHTASGPFFWTPGAFFWNILYCSTQALAPAKQGRS